MAELVNGRLEILPMPTIQHQRILRLLISLFENAVPADAIVLFAPLPTKLFPGTIREPDLLYIAPANRPDPDVKYPSHIDLALEIVSEGTDARRRDYEDKQIDYAKAGIAEYWIVDPVELKITVLVLDGAAYVEHGVFTANQSADGKLIPGLSVSVDAVLNAL